MHLLCILVHGNANTIAPPTPPIIILLLKVVLQLNLWFMHISKKTQTSLLAWSGLQVTSLHIKQWEPIVWLAGKGMCPFKGYRTRQWLPAAAQLGDVTYPHRSRKWGGRGLYRSMLMQKGRKKKPTHYLLPRLGKLGDNWWDFTSLRKKALTLVNGQASLALLSKRNFDSLSEILVEPPSNN